MANSFGEDVSSIALDFAESVLSAAIPAIEVVAARLTADRGVGNELVAVDHVDADPVIVGARKQEGAALAAAIARMIAGVENLLDRAEADPSRTPEAIRQRLATQLATLGAEGLSSERLHQEAAVLAVKADIREEIDRLRHHCQAARELLAADEPIGRRFEFLAQEFHRESNTICSKSNSISLTRIGLDLKAVVDQLREQAQNLE